jgi:hypothetical protein
MKGKEMFVINGYRIWAESEEQAKEQYERIKNF